MELEMHIVRVRDVRYTGMRNDTRDITRVYILQSLGTRLRN
jgi:hypothetical protein